MNHLLLFENYIDVLLLEKNVPTNPKLWNSCKAQARAKFDVYPSAYANGWACKLYKKKGGGWRKKKAKSKTRKKRK